MALRTKRTAKAANTILSTLSDGLSIAAACSAAGIGRTMFFEWRRDDPEFAEQCEAAIEQGTDKLEDIARQRAAEGSDTLLIFLLKGRRPDKYRENIRQSIDMDVKGALTVVIGERPDGPQ